jgi:uncharacterized protein (TIGR03790 family)
LIRCISGADGRKLAEYYAEQRHVPDGRILELDLPSVDEIPADLFDERMVGAIRAFLLSNHLEKQVTCIVTFYGVPLRIEPDPTVKEDVTAGLRAEMQRNEAAVDSELAFLPLIETRPPLAGPLAPPLALAATAPAVSVSPFFFPLKKNGPSA